MGELDTDPISIDLNVDAALVLRDIVGIDSYPPVLAIIPTIYRLDDRERVTALVEKQLAEAGIIENDQVHPRVAEWLHSLDRPDVELVVRIIDNGRGGHTPTMLRMSLVRRADKHVLAVRCDDQVIIQSVFHEGRQLDTLAAVLGSALGAYPVLSFDPFTAPAAELDEIPADADSRRAAFRELGAAPHTASVLTRALEEVVRRAEVLVIEHRDGGSDAAHTKTCMSVLDTLSGRLVVTPTVAMDGRMWSTFRPGDDPALQGGINALVELLPGGSWFDTVRTG